MVDQSEYSSNQGRFVAKLLLLVKVYSLRYTKFQKQRHVVTVGWDPALSTAIARNRYRLQSSNLDVVTPIDSVK